MRETSRFEASIETKDFALVRRQLTGRSVAPEVSKNESVLSYAAPGQKVTTVAPGTATFPLRIFYAPGVTPASFTATMNSTSIASLFHPVPGTSEVVHVPLSAGKNTLKLSIQGTAGSHSGTDQDALIFNN